MKKGNIRDLHYGREVWRHLEPVMYNHSSECVFEDWLDLMLSAHLSLTDNMSRPNFVEKLESNKLDGQYEDRYMEIVSRYANDHTNGDRAIDHFAAAHVQLVKEIEATEKDVLGEIYMAMITFGQHGQFFTPQHISSFMAELVRVENGGVVNDPTCGSGIMLIEAGKRDPTARLTGCDLDSRCAKMAALNMLFFDLNARIAWGDSLKMEFYTEWHIQRGGFIWEREISEEDREAMPEKPKAGQQELFAA